MTRTSALAAALAASALMGGAVFAQQQYVPSRNATPTDEQRQAIDDLERELAGIESRAQESAYPTDERSPAPGSDYDDWVFSYTRGAYQWHQTSTIIIFWVVVTLVLSGIVLAAWQLGTWIKRVAAYDEVFLARLRQGRPADTEAITNVGQAPGSEMSLKSDALTLSSPYVGVVILGLSMGFFLAYLLLVYPIVQGPGP